ncbi:MAG: hypothetical protein Q9167_004158 [Letrouitia subvulpina]
MTKVIFIPMDVQQILVITAAIVIALVRSKSVYNLPRERWDATRLYRSATDLFASTIKSPLKSHKLPNGTLELAYTIVHFYARLLLLRCYEDYTLRHDPEPINPDKSDRCCTNWHILAMHQRRLELVKFKQNLAIYIDALSAGPKNLEPGGIEYRQKLQGLTTDLNMLLSLYDESVRTYDSCFHEMKKEFKDELTSEQLEEARQSTAAAISLGKLSSLAFLYLPLNFVCAMLSMNLTIFGQGNVSVQVFLALLVVFSLLTYLPVYRPRISEQGYRQCKVAFRLILRSPPAGFWFLAFTLAHNDQQNFELTSSGLAQVLLGYTGYKTKGFLEDDASLGKATLGGEDFWKEKLKKIYLAVEEVKTDDEEPMRRRV